MDRGPQFPEIGRIRKGEQKDPNKNQPGKDLKYFRFEIDENETEAIEFIKKLYPGEPKALRVLLPFKTVEENFQTWREAYVAGGLLHRCGYEDRLIQYQIQDGKTVISHGRPIRKCDGGEVGSYKSQDGEDIPVFCKPVGRLKVIIPELMRMVFFTVLTSSIHDIENLKAELWAYENMGPKGLAGIPLILKRVPKKISTPSGTNGARARREKWLLHVEVDPKWAKAVFIAMAESAMPEMPLLEAPKNVTEGEWTAEEEEEPEEFSKSKPADDFGGPVEQEESVPATVKETKAVQNTAAVRPYEPEVVKQRISEKAASYAQEGKKASEQFRGLVCGMIEQCFDPEDAETKKKKRHSVLMFIAGKDSAKEIPDWYFYAIRDWLNWKQDSGGMYIIESLSIKEAHKIIEKVLVDAGQQKFPD